MILPKKHLKEKLIIFFIDFFKAKLYTVYYIQYHE